MTTGGMNRAMTLLVVSACLVVPAVAAAQTGTITTVAGGGPTTMPGLNGVVSSAASTGEIGQMAWDASRQRLYFTSTTFHRVYVYDPVAHRATPLAGNGFNGFAGDGGSAAQASFAGPIGLALDPTNPNVLYVADTGSNRVRRVNLSTGIVDTVLGSGVCNSGEPTTAAVAATSANLCAPGQLTVDGSGVLYVFDLGKSAVWRLSSGQAATIAGNGTALATAPGSGGSATSMSLGSFSGIAVDPAGQFLYLNEFFGLRRLALATGVLSAPLDLGATSVPLRHGSPVVVEPVTGRVIYAIFPVPPSGGGGACDPQTDPTCTGGGSAPPPTESLFSYAPSTRTKTQIAGQGSTLPPFLNPTSDVNLGSGASGVGDLVAIAPATGASAAFVATRSGWVHSMNSLGSTPSFLTILGNGARSYCGDGGPATNACLDGPTSVSVAADGTIYIVDAGNGVIRFVDHAGVIHSLVSPRAAGIVPTAIVAPPAGTAFPGADGLPMPVTTLLFTSELAHQVFALDTATDTTFLYSGTGQPACTVSSSGFVFCDNNADAGLERAKYGEPLAMAADSFGNPYVADAATNVVLCLQCTDSIVGVAGGGSFVGSGNPAQWTVLNGPVAVAVDSDNGLLIAEQVGQTVRRVNPDPRHGYVYPFDPRSEIITDVMTAASAGATFSPVGVAIVPGKALASDAATNRVISAVHPGGACTAGLGQLQSSVFAGGGTKLQDNVPATQARFGSRLVESGVFDPAGIGQIASSFINGAAFVFIVDGGSNRIRAVTAAGNHPPIANAGPDRSVAPDSTGFAQVTLDGSASTDPDCDVLTYTWTSPELPAPLVGTSVQVNVSGAGTAHTFTLTVNDGWGGTSTATVTITVASFDLAISGTASAGRIDPGQTVTYNAVITNRSSVDGTGVGVTLLPATTELVSATASQGTCDGPAYGTSGFVQCSLGDLAAGATVNIAIVLRPAVEEILNNTLMVFADQGDDNPANDTLAITTQVGGSTGGGGGGTTGGGGTGGGGTGSGGACSCGLTGSYVDPLPAVDVGGDPLMSPGNKFQVSALVDNANNLDTLTITRASDGAVLLAGTAFPITVHWGFSPDGNRIAIHAVAIGTQEDEIWVYDLSVKPARQIVHYRLPIVSDRLQFSPSGYYFLLTALVAQGRTEIDIYRIAGVSIEDRVYQTTFSFQSVPGIDEDEFGAVDWGFSPDMPETSFVYAFGNGQNQVSLNLANLTSPHTVPVLSQNLTSGSGFWRFNPCGNLLGVVSQPFIDKVDVGLFKTSDGTRVGADKQFTFAAVTLSTTTTGEFATVGSNQPSLLATDPSCNANTLTGLDVNVAATDPVTGTTAISLTFSLVTQAGQTAVTSSSGGNPPPAGFSVGDPPIYYDVTTTAVYSGQITVCISYNGVTFAGSPKIFHYVNGAWVDSTTSVDTTHKTVCGVVTSLSPFALFAPVTDTTPPSIVCASADVLWHSADVAIACTASDAGSGLANLADASFTLSTSVPSGTETSSAQTGTRTVCDRAGNCATAGPLGPIRIDKKAPTVSVSAPVNGATYVLNQAVAASYLCSDAGSGIGVCAGTVSNGAPIATGSVGSSTFTVTATDNAGNTATQTVRYSVGYNVCLVYDSTKAKKSGSVYPIQIQLCDAAGTNLSSPSIVVHAVGVTQLSTNAPGTLDDAGNSNPDFDFRYDATLAAYVFNLKTTGFATGTYALNSTAGADPAIHSAKFQIK